MPVLVSGPGIVLDGYDNQTVDQTCHSEGRKSLHDYNNISYNNIIIILTPICSIMSSKKALPLGHSG